MTHRALELLNLTESSFVLDIGCGSGLSGEILTDPTTRLVRGRKGVPLEEEEEQEDESEEGEQDMDEADMDAGDGAGRMASTGQADTLNGMSDKDEAQKSRSVSGPPVQQELSHTWIGLDISASMLSIARFTRNVSGDLFLSDMGQGIPFRPGTFDAAISISALQWLCTAESNDPSAQPAARLKRFFDSLYISLRRGGKAVLQFYPKNKEQTRMIGKAAKAAGFGAGVLVDDEGTKSEKLFLVCVVGGGDVSGIVGGMDGVQVDSGDAEGRRAKEKRGRAVKGGKGWILRKKEQMERKGKVVKADSRYTGRKRKPKF